MTRLLEICQKGQSSIRPNKYPSGGALDESTGVYFGILYAIEAGDLEIAESTQSRKTEA